jgi:urease accessory protein
MMLSPTQWLATLHLSDSALPTGAFAYSEGLEGAVQQGAVTSAAELSQWMELWREEVFRHCEGPALRQLMRAIQGADGERLRHVNAQLTALKPAQTLRDSSHSYGRRLLSTCRPLYPEAPFEQLDPLQPHLNGITVQATLFASVPLPLEQALATYAFGRLNQLLSAALRLFAIGQQAGQRVFQAQLQQLPTDIQRIVQAPEAPLRAFTPRMDVFALQHHELYTKLFRS